MPTRRRCHSHIVVFACRRDARATSERVVISDVYPSADARQQQNVFVLLFDVRDVPLSPSAAHSRDEVTSDVQGPARWRWRKQTRHRRRALRFRVRHVLGAHLHLGFRV